MERFWFIHTDSALINSDTLDTDQDGLTDSFEQQFGLDPNSAAGANGASGDPDGDGLTNAEELARTTHPRGTFQRFLAEGATNDPFFTTRISVANPSPAQAAIVLLRFQRSDGTEVPSAFTLGPLQSRKVVVNQVTGMANAEFAINTDAGGGLLDDATGKQILKLLQDTSRENGRTVIIITHNHALTAMADRVIQISCGRVVDMRLNDAPLSADAIDW